MSLDLSTAFTGIRFPNPYLLASAPPPEAEQIVYRALLDLARGGERAVVVIAGNHDNARRFAAVAPLLAGVGVQVVPMLTGPADGGVIEIQLRSGVARLADEDRAFNREGAADLGIVSDAVDTEHLQTRPFRDDPLVLIMPRDHPLADAGSVSFTNTLHHDYVGLNANSALAVYLEEQALHAGSRLLIRIRADGFDGVMRMVARGAGVAIVPLAAVERWPGETSFKSLALQEPWAQRKLLLCARDFTTLPAYAKALLHALTLP